MIDAMQHPMTQTIAAKFVILKPLLDERARRLWAAAEARALGTRWDQPKWPKRLGWHGRPFGQACKNSRCRPTATGLRLPPERLRRPGGGRKPLGMRDPHLLQALETLVDPVTRGDPMSLFSMDMQECGQVGGPALQAQGHAVSERTVNRLLHDLGYSLQSNRKTLEGYHHPDRDAQFQYIHRRAKVFQKQGQPVVSVDTKKKGTCGPVP